MKKSNTSDVDEDDEDMESINLTVNSDEEMNELSAFTKMERQCELEQEIENLRQENRSLVIRYEKLSTLYSATLSKNKILLSQLRKRAPSISKLPVIFETDEFESPSREVPSLNFEQLVTENDCDTVTPRSKTPYDIYENFLSDFEEENDCDIEYNNLILESSESNKDESDVITYVYDKLKILYGILGGAQLENDWKTGPVIQTLCKFFCEQSEPIQSIYVQKLENDLQKINACSEKLITRLRDFYILFEGALKIKIITKDFAPSVKRFIASCIRDLNLMVLIPDVYSKIKHLHCENTSYKGLLAVCNTVMNFTTEQLFQEKNMVASVIEKLQHITKKLQITVDTGINNSTIIDVNKKIKFLNEITQIADCIQEFQINLKNPETDELSLFIENLKHDFNVLMRKLELMDSKEIKECISKIVRHSIFSHSESEDLSTLQEESNSNNADDMVKREDSLTERDNVLKENKEATDKLGSLEDQLSLQKHMLIEYKQEIENHINEINTLKEVLTTKETEILDLLTEKEGWEFSLSKAESKVKQLQNKLSEKQTYEMITQDLEIAKNELKVANEKLENQEQAISKLIEDGNVANEILAAKENDLLQLSMEKEYLKDSLTKQCDTIKQDLEKTKNELKETKQKLQNRERRISKMTEDLTDKENHLAAIIMETEYLRDCLRDAENEIQSLQKSLYKRQKYNAIKQDLQKAKNELKVANEKLEKKEQECLKLILDKNVANQILTAKESDLLELNMEKEHLKDSLTKIDNEMKLLQEEFHQRQTCDTIKQELEITKNDLHEAKKKLEDKEQQLSEVVADRDAISQTLTSKENHILVLGMEKECSKIFLARAEDEIQLLQNKLHETQNYDKVKQNLEIAKNELKIANEKLKNKEEALLEFAEDRYLTDQVLFAKENDIVNLKMEKEHLKDYLTKVEDEMKLLQNQLHQRQACDTVKQDLEITKNELQEAMKKLENKEQELSKMIAERGTINQIITTKQNHILAVNMEKEYLKDNLTKAENEIKLLHNKLHERLKYDAVIQDLEKTKYELKKANERLLELPKVIADKDALKKQLKGIEKCKHKLILKLQDVKKELYKISAEKDLYLQELKEQKENVSNELSDRTLTLLDTFLNKINSDSVIKIMEDQKSSYLELLKGEAENAFGAENKLIKKVLSLVEVIECNMRNIYESKINNLSQENKALLDQFHSQKYIYEKMKEESDMKISSYKKRLVDLEDKFKQVHVSGVTNTSPNCVQQIWKIKRFADQDRRRSFGSSILHSRDYHDSYKENIESNNFWELNNIFKESKPYNFSVNCATEGVFLENVATEFSLVDNNQEKIYLQEESKEDKGVQVNESDLQLKMTREENIEEKYKLAKAVARLRYAEIKKLRNEVESLQETLNKIVQKM